MNRTAWLLAIFLPCACSSSATSTDANPAMDGSASVTDGSTLTSGGDGAMPPPDLAGDLSPAKPGDFPATSPWYEDIHTANVASDSATIISHLQSAGWGTLNIDVSFSILHADDSVAKRTYTTNGSYYSPDCDLAPVPIPPGGAIENYPLNGYTCGGGDCHLLVYQGTRLYELGVANITGGLYDGTTFTGGCLAIWDLTKDYWTSGAMPYSRGDQCTSADAAGFPIAPLLLTAADLSGTAITHAVRFTLDNSLIRQQSYVHPATHGTGGSGGGASGGADTMPYGSRLRLKPGTYAGNAKAQLLIKALQTYGMFMADGGNLYISGTADLIGVIDASAVSSLSASDFEVIDQGPAIAWTGDCTRTPITN